MSVDSAVSKDRGRDWVWIAIVMLAVVFATAVAYYQLTTHHADPDTFWHMATGRYIVENGSVPQYDVLSWYGHEQQLKITTQEWLYGAFVYECYALGGFALVNAVTAILFGLLFWLVYAYSETRTGRPTLSLIVATISIMGTAASVAPRPHSISFVLIVATALALEKRRWLAAVPLMLVAVNVHGGTYPIFLLLIAYYSYRAKPWLVPVAAITVLLNPQGFALVLYPFRAIAYPGVLAIQEMGAPSLPHAWYLFLTIGVLALLTRERRIPLDTSLFALALVGLSLAGKRYGAYLYLLGLPLLVPHIAPALSVAQMRDGGEHLPDRTTAPGKWFRRVIIAELTLAIVLMFAMASSRPFDPDAGYPAKAARYVTEQQFNRVLNLYEEGGYLAFEGVPPFVDGRLNQFTPVINPGEHSFERYIDMLRLRADYRTFLRENGIVYILLPRKVPLYRALVHDPTVSQMYADKTHVVMRYDGAAAP